MDNNGGVVCDGIVKVPQRRMGCPQCKGIIFKLAVSKANGGHLVCSCDYLNNSSKFSCGSVWCGSPLNCGHTLLPMLFILCCQLA